MRTRKGQHVILQEVLVYGLGIIMLIGVLATFNEVKSSVESKIFESNAALVANLLKGGINDINALEQQSWMMLDVPRKSAGGGNYKISTLYVGSLYQLMIVNERWTYKELLNTPVGDSTVISGSDQIIISKNENKIQLRGV